MKLLLMINITNFYEKQANSVNSKQHCKIITNNISSKKV